MGKDDASTAAEALIRTLSKPLRFSVSQRLQERNKAV